MKRIIESFQDFITGSEIHQNPGAWEYYGLNPKKKTKNRRRARRQKALPNKTQSSEN
jgi:hypothetical protein